MQGKLRAEIHCISGKVDLRFWLGSWMEATLPYQSTSPLDVKVALILQPVFCFQTCRTRQVPKGYPLVLPGGLTMARRGPGGCQQAHTATGCWRHIEAWPFIRACCLGLLPRQHDCAASVPEPARPPVTQVSRPSGEVFHYSQDWEAELFS